jgi:mannose-6-phosphate isomerase-like protein (cupin superfamily)
MISKENAQHYNWGDGCDGWTLVNHQNMLVIHEKMPSDTSELRHFHSVSRQFFFVLSGELTMELEGVMHHLSSQQGIEIPPNTRHQARNQSAAPVEFLVISHPSSRGDRTEIS